MWAGRLFIEHLNSNYAFFITLTYNDNNIRYIDDLHTLVKSDIQLFIKKLRKYFKCRYFCAGEYGDNTLRAHYHIALYINDKIDLNDFHYFILKKWGIGEITIDFLDAGHYTYITKYLSKRLTGKWKQEFINATSLCPEFSLMSRNPAIGYIHDYQKLCNIYEDGFICNGKRKYLISRFLKNEVKGCDLDLYEQIRDNRMWEMFDKEQEQPFPDYLSIRSLREKQLTEFTFFDSIKS